VARYRRRHICFHTFHHICSAHAQELKAERCHALVFLSQPLQRANQALRKVEHYRALAQGVAFRYSHFLAREPRACGCQEDANDTANALVPFLGRTVGSQVAPPEGKGGKVGLLGHIKWLYPVRIIRHVLDDAREDDKGAGPRLSFALLHHIRGAPNNTPGPHLCMHQE
jgi:hypothetical protein